MHRALSYLLVLHSSIAVPPTYLYSAPLGVRLYQVAAHAPFVASFSSFVFGVVHCTVLATSRCNNGLALKCIFLKGLQPYQWKTVKYWWSCCCYYWKLHKNSWLRCRRGQTLVSMGETDRWTNFLQEANTANMPNWYKTQRLHCECTHHSSFIP